MLWSIANPFTRQTTMPHSARTDSRPAEETAADADADTAAPVHGELTLPAVTVESYSLEVRDSETGGFYGDRASRTAFGKMLDLWRGLFAEMNDGKDAFGTKPTQEIGKRRLDELLAQNGPAAAAIRAASEDYAEQLAQVVRRFQRQKSWQGVERVVIGGGFQQSELGKRAVGRAAELLAQAKAGVSVRTLHHHADEGGLIGWLHVAPPEVLERHDAMLAVDIGGTNVRCGIVRVRGNGPDLTRAEVVGRDKWGHADDEDVKKREDLVLGIAGMLENLIRAAKQDGIKLAPFVGVACPGMVRPDGSIAGGTQNLPGNWESTRFHLPRHLCEQLPRIGGEPTQVRLHNDAVVQGLSELPFMNDVKRWAVLTVGTGLGNASFTNR